MTTPSILPTEPRIRNKMAFLKYIKVTGKISTDQTGCFPITSSRGSKYLMVLYDHGSNAIIAEPLEIAQRSQTHSCILRPPHSPIQTWANAASSNDPQRVPSRPQTGYVKHWHRLPTPSAAPTLHQCCKTRHRHLQIPPDCQPQHLRHLLSVAPLG